jgi:hypothetical protein
MPNLVCTSTQGDTTKFCKQHIGWISGLARLIHHDLQAYEIVEVWLPRWGHSVQTVGNTFQSSMFIRIIKLKGPTLLDISTWIWIWFRATLRVCLILLFQHAFVLKKEKAEPKGSTQSRSQVIKNNDESLRCKRIMIPFLPQQQSQRGHQEGKCKPVRTGCGCVHQQHRHGCNTPCL